MITQRDLDAISPPPRRRAGPAPADGWAGKLPPRDVPAISGPHPSTGAPIQAAGPGASRGSGGVSVAAVLAISGPCRRQIPNELYGRVTALLAAGVGELVVDLSAVTETDMPLLDILGRLHRIAESHDATLTVVGAVGDLDTMLETAELAQASLISRSLPHQRPQPAPDPIGPLDPNPGGTGAL